jgi:methylamine dehydrogenase light chain
MSARRRHQGSLSGRIDAWIESRSRGAAQRASRRGFLAALGGALFGAAALPLLPVARGTEAGRLPGPDESKLRGAVADPQDCIYWRYCGIDGFICSCCGGGVTMCAPGTELSRVTWIGTCRNPGDGKDYVISYNDCCGRSSCGRCECYRNEGDMPMYVPSKSNDTIWCVGTKSNAYHCTIAAIIGVAVAE